jgi:LuxR family maltose regulon positive regulatory protein
MAGKTTTIPILRTKLQQPPIVGDHVHRSHLLEHLDQRGHRSHLSNQALVEPLTNREIEILLILPKGLSNQEIAERLFISPETVKRHLYNIYQKFDVKSRQQAIVKAKSLGIL